MRTEIDGTRHCDAYTGLDHAKCTNPVFYACGCRRCDSEPKTSEVFHACRSHRSEADAQHERMRGYRAEWWQGQVVK